MYLLNNINTWDLSAYSFMAMGIF